MVKKILVSQPAPTSEKSPYFEIAEKLGVEFVFHPLIKVECLSAKEFRQQKVQILDHSAIVFNSRNAIDHFFTLCKEMRVTIPEDMKYFGLSESIALYIQKYVQYRKRKVFFGTTGKWPELVAVMAKHKAERYLVPLSDVHNDEVKQLLDAKKLKHTEWAGVQSLLTTFPAFEQGDVRLAAFGKATAKAITDAGLRLDLEAPSPKAPSMTGCLELYLEEENKKK